MGLGYSTEWRQRHGAQYPVWTLKPWRYRLERMFPSLARKRWFGAR